MRRLAAARRKGFAFSYVVIVEEQIYNQRKHPAYGPRQPYSVRAEERREDIGENNTQCKVKTGAYHKRRHNAATSYTAVNYYLYADKEIERGNDSQKLTAGCDYLSVSLCRKQVYKRSAEKQEAHYKRYRYNKTHQHTRLHTRFNTVGLVCAYVLSAEARHAV